MLKSLLTYLKEGNIFNAVEVQNNNTYHFISVKRKNNELDIVTVNSFESPGQIPEFIPKNTSVFLIANTEHILTKIVSGQKEEGLTVVNKAFPNLKMDDFYFETFQSGENSIVSICRKDEIHTLLKNFEEHKIGISGFSLGVSRIHNVLPFIEEKEVQLNNHLVTTANTGIDSIKINETGTVKKYNVNGMEVSGRFLLGFSGILGNILQQNTFTSNFTPVNSALKDEFLNKRFFNLFSKAALGFLLTILLINFLVFNHYFSKSEQLTQTSEVNKINKEKLLKLDAQVRSKEKMAEDVLSASSSRASFYIDQIASVMPATLLLNELNYQPVKKQVKDGEAIEFDKDVILISGISSNSDDFSRWVETMEKFEWTGTVAIKDYDYTNKSSSLFTLLIKISHEEQN